MHKCISAFCLTKRDFYAATGQNRKQNMEHNGKTWIIVEYYSLAFVYHVNCMKYDNQHPLYNNATNAKPYSDDVAMCDFAYTKHHGIQAYQHTVTYSL